ASVTAPGDDCAARPINPALNAMRAVIRRSENVSSRFQRASFQFASDMRLLSTFAMTAVGAFDGDDVARQRRAQRDEGRRWPVFGRALPRKEGLFGGKSLSQAISRIVCTLRLLDCIDRGAANRAGERLQ